MELIGDFEKASHMIESAGLVASVGLYFARNILRDFLDIRDDVSERQIKRDIRILEQQDRRAEKRNHPSA